MENELQEFKNERQNLFLFIYRKRKIIIIVTAAATILAIIATLLMTPIFRSTAVVFPAATSTVSFSEQRNAKASSMDIGEEEQTEQMVQILQSSRIRDKIIERFNLREHYEIDSNDANLNYNLIKAYNNHFFFVRTRYGSIQIDVLDRDPVLAAEMANTIVDLIDTVKNDMIAERTYPAYETNLRKKLQLDKELRDILDKLDSLGSLGVISLDGRTNLFQAYVDSRNETDRIELKEKIDINLKHGALFDGLEFVRNEKIRKLEDFQESYEQAESDANTLFTHKFVVERAVVADKKDKPKRMIIVLLVAAGTFVFMIFLLLLLDRYKELKKAA